MEIEFKDLLYEEVKPGTGGQDSRTHRTEMAQELYQVTENVPTTQQISRPAVRPNIPTVFNQSMYDPTSAMILGETNIHMSRARLQSLISEQTSQMYQETVRTFSGMHDNLSYEDLLASLLFDGERLLVNNQYIYYSFISYLDEFGKPSGKEPMRQGRAFLTTQRLLLLSAENTAGASLSKFGDPKKLPGGYKVQTTCNDTLNYVSVPISCFRSVELYASVGARSEVNIQGTPPCCFGLCGCFGMNMCLKGWLYDPPQCQAYNDRYVTMGVIMPPWGHRMMLQMYLNPGVALTTVKDFIRDLQRHAPGLHDKLAPST
ncbi:uncharacterized protein [Ptychodera flava]|uniref:uncharacterized protein n=1 Tax=Ptychodera flava TaxID=63121 RepID=UPI00396A8C76